MLLKCCRVLRAIRVLRLIRGMKILLDCIKAVVIAVANVGSLILLMLFIFAVIGMNTFSGIKYQTEINENNNFNSFGLSFIILLRCATGEKWHIIMRELAVESETINRLNI
jgi:hypothetical protein